MDGNSVIDKMINSLEINGELEFFAGDRKIYIHSIDDKEGFSYITPNGQEFASSREAVEWAIKELKGLENISVWN